MERFIALLSWVALVVVLLAAFFVRHEPPRRQARQRSRRAAPSDRAPLRENQLVPEREFP
jgi:hypothetical protein